MNQEASKHSEKHSRLNQKVSKYSSKHSSIDQKASKHTPAQAQHSERVLAASQQHHSSIIAAERQDNRITQTAATKRKLARHSTLSPSSAPGPPAPLPTTPTRLERYPLEQPEKSTIHTSDHSDAPPYYHLKFLLPPSNSRYHLPVVSAK